MKTIMLAAVAALSLTTSAHAGVDFDNGPRQFNLECVSKGLGQPVRQTTAIDLDTGMARHIERNIGSSQRAAFHVVSTKGAVDLRGDNADEITNKVKRGGMWQFQQNGYATFGVCKQVAYTPAP